MGAVGACSTFLALPNCMLLSCLSPLGAFSPPRPLTLRYLYAVQPCLQPHLPCPSSRLPVLIFAAPPPPPYPPRLTMCQSVHLPFPLSLLRHLILLMCHSSPAPLSPLILHPACPASTTQCYVWLGCGPQGVAPSQQRCHVAALLKQTDLVPRQTFMCAVQSANPPAIA